MDNQDIYSLGFDLNLNKPFPQEAASSVVYDMINSAFDAQQITTGSPAPSTASGLTLAGANTTEHFSNVAGTQAVVTVPVNIDPNSPFVIRGSMRTGNSAVNAPGLGLKLNNTEIFLPVSIGSGITGVGSGIFEFVFGGQAINYLLCGSWLNSIFKATGGSYKITMGYPDNSMPNERITAVTIEANNAGVGTELFVTNVYIYKIATGNS